MGQPAQGCAVLRWRCLGLLGVRVVDCIKVAAKGEPKDEAFQGERAKARVKVLCTVGQAQHPLSIRGVRGGVPGPGSSSLSCVRGPRRGRGSG